MPALTPENEAYYGPWPPVEPCRKDGHDWGGLGPGRVVPFPVEGQRQTCSVCGCARYTEFGEIHYQVPRDWLQAAYEARQARQTDQEPS